MSDISAIDNSGSAPQLNPDNQGSTLQTNKSALNIAIVGSGICGMCAAITLAENGHQVTLYERDGAPPQGDADNAFFDWNRRGAAQFRHPHAFLGLICNLFAERYPALLQDLFEAGARKVDFAEMLPFALRADYTPEPGDERMWVLMCRRATMEQVIRRYVEQFANVTIVNRCHVQGVVTDTSTGAMVARGLRVRYRGDAQQATDQAEEVLTDIVVDASGRSSKFPQWWRQLGVAVEEENDDAEIVYYTRHYQLRPGQEEPVRGELPAAGDLGYLKFGVFPGDNGHFAIIVCVPKAEVALVEAVRDSEQFHKICESIPGLTPWVAQDRSEPTTESFGIGGIHAVWRYYVQDDKPLVHNFFAVGDSSVRTNPLYGRGCSTGVLHASILADVLADSSVPVTRALNFHERTAAELRPIFDASLSEDKSGIKRANALREGRALDKPDSLKKWFGLAFGDALSAAAAKELHVVRGIMRTVNLLEKPGAFLKDPSIRRTVLKYMFRGRKRNAATRLQPGPSRQEMLALLELPDAEHGQAEVA